MRFSTFALAVCFSFMATLSHAAGLKLFEVPADAEGAALQAAMWSPCAVPSGEVQLGRATLPGVRDCPIEGDKLPLIVVSHGYGGSYLGHHDTAETLADAGFVVVALNHPDDTSTSSEATHGRPALTNRPTDIKRLIDFMLGASPDAARIDPQRIGFFGFSRGGYTGLVVGGANPDFLQLRPRCQDQADTACRSLDPSSLPTQPLTHDPRIKVLVIADPLSVVFPTADSLKDIRVPLQLWSSERGGDGVFPQDVAAVASHLPVKADFHLVPNSGHFAFLAPCSAGLAKARPELCIDAPDFDRVAFHRDLDAQALAFFREHLAGTVQH
ncbi:dienelactone hydrolase [Bradyrhizobium prioriisuperbiae]|uniref:alpha/beta hydrolase family protein n=1 Tax=Bradyrhizobium prioriisuperbiae TaxID=2854389 RepID=UPI0028EDDED6|nr:dienelactone hydrolase [Bradyrhizobium prioritasuperba]